MLIGQRASQIGGTFSPRLREQREKGRTLIGCSCLANESVPENYSESDEIKHVNEGGTDRRLFKCYMIFPNHSNTRMFS